jgi:hypothetical protein
MNSAANFYMTLGAVPRAHTSNPHPTAAEAPGEAQPTAVADVLPKGRAWRGWLWISLLIGLLAFLVLHWVRHQ